MGKQVILCSFVLDLDLCIHPLLDFIPHLCGKRMKRDLARCELEFWGKTNIQLTVTQLLVPVMGKVEDGTYV
jgi:hypothetical protein